MSGERGSISIWMLTSIAVMTLLVGLAVDLSGQVHAQQRARNVAAQAARAAGQELRAAPAVEGQYLAVDPARARTAAGRFLAAAGVEGTTTVVNGNEIEIRVTDSYTPQFLSILGINELPVSGTASARLVRTLGGQER